MFNTRPTGVKFPFLQVWLKHNLTATSKFVFRESYWLLAILCKNKCKVYALIMEQCVIYTVISMHKCRNLCKTK